MSYSSLVIMKVYLTHYTRNTEQFDRYYEIILESISKLGHEIIYHRKNRNKQIEGSKSKKPSYFYKEMMQLISEADVCIFDTSQQSMRIGHQLTYALENSTPVLVLAHQSAGDISSFFIAGSKSGYLNIYSYASTYELKDIIPKFLASNKFSKIRFNLALEKHYGDFMEQCAKKENISKTDVIKKALECLKEKDSIVE